MPNNGAAIFNAAATARPAGAVPAPTAPPSGADVFNQTAGNPGAAAFHAANGTSTTPAPAHQGGGGLWGDITHAASVAGGALASGANTVANYTQSTGTGIYDFAKASGIGGVLAASTHPWDVNLVTKEVTNVPAMEHPFSGPEGINPANIKGLLTGNEQDPFAKAFYDMFVQPVKQTAEHPGRDPVMSALVAASVLSAGFGGIARAGYIGKLARAGATDEEGNILSAGAKVKLAGKAVSPRYKVPTAARVLYKVNQTFKTNAAGEILDEAGNVIPKNIHGQLVLNKTPEGDEIQPAYTKTTTPFERHASSSHLVRAGQSVVDTITQRRLNAGKPAVGGLRRTIGERVRQTSDVRGALESAILGHGGAVKSHVGRVGSAFDNGLTRKEANMAVKLRSWRVTPEEAAAEYSRLADNPQVGANVKALRRNAKVAQSVADKGVLKKVDETGTLRVDQDKFPKLAKTDELVRRGQERGSNILSGNKLMTEQGQVTRRALPAETLRSENARNPVTGVREGEGFTSLKTSIKPSPKTIVAQARTHFGKIGVPQKPSLSFHATGEGIKLGKEPDNVIGGAAETLHELQRYGNTVEFRNWLTKYGNDVKTHQDQILVPTVKNPPDLPEKYQTLIGQKTSTVDTLEEKVGQDDGVGTHAPAGYKWVDERAIPGDLKSTATARGPFGVLADDINRAVTAATVYFRVGHLPTRFFTNATTNLIQGSLNPKELGNSSEVSYALTEQERRELVALSGPGGYKGVLPSQIQGTLGKGVVSRGANWWHKNIDSGPRMNAVLYELRQRGITTPEEVRQVIAYAKDPHAGVVGKSAAWESKVNAALRDARREAIMYDGLGNFEKAAIARAFWFYPWFKGATRWTGRLVAEHPNKALVVGSLGKAGADANQRQLGPRPSYELGLTKVGGSASNPLTSNFSSFTPFGTVGSVAQMVTHPLSADTGAIGAVTPALSALGAAFQGKNPVSQALSSTPEYNIASSIFQPQGKGLFPTSTTRLFGSTGQSQLARAFFGAAFPRRTNRSRLNIDALHEKQKKTQITIYSGG